MMLEQMGIDNFERQAQSFKIDEDQDAGGKRSLVRFQRMAWGMDNCIMKQATLVATRPAVAKGQWLMGASVAVGRMISMVFPGSDRGERFSPAPHRYWENSGC